MEGPGAMSIVVDDLTKVFESGRGRRRRRVEAVRAVSFSVDEAERIAFIGPNGAGKSTTIKMLTGILFPTSGSAEVLGMTPWRQRRSLTRRIGTLFGQRSQLWLELTPRETLRMLAAIHGLDRARLRRRIAELGELVDAGELLPTAVRSPSLGQRTRSELAASLPHHPPILF